MMICATVGLLLSQSLYFSYLCLLLNGCSLSCRVTVAYIYLMELTPKKHRVWAGTFNGVVEVIWMIAATIYFLYISKYYLPFASMAVVCASSSLLLMLRLPESPLFLLNKGRR